MVFPPLNTRKTSQTNNKTSQINPSLQLPILLPNKQLEKMKVIQIKWAERDEFCLNPDWIFCPPKVRKLITVMTVSPLKSKIIIGLVLITISLKGMAQEKNWKIVKETLTSEVINVSADSLWAICREFDKTAEWTSTLNHSYGIGEVQHEGITCSARVCETNLGKGNKVVEELLMFSDENKELSYNLVEGAPGFITLATNHWKVTKVGSNKSKIEMNVTMHMKRFAGFFLAGLITKQMKKQVTIVLSELKTYAETGQVSAKKKKQLDKQKKKR